MGGEWPPSRKRNRLLWIILIALVVLIGLASRRFGAYLPGFLAAYAGDTLWATAVFLGIGLLQPRALTWRVAALALFASLLVEVSQLSKAPWLEAIRRTTIGGLAFGYDFVWSDLACYAVGVGLGVALEGALSWRPFSLGPETPHRWFAARRGGTRARR